MYRKRETKIADAISTDSSRDRVFAYTVLFVIGLVAVIMGYILGGLISTLTKNMEATASNINSMSEEMVLMRKDIRVMAYHIQSIDRSVISMSTDISTMSKSVSSMAVDMNNMDQNTDNMKKDMHDISKLNPLRLFK